MEKQGLVVRRMCAMYDVLAMRSLGLVTVCAGETCRGDAGPGGAADVCHA